MTIIGIDPGLDGAIACLTDKGIRLYPMPTIKLDKGRQVDAYQLAAALQIEALTGDRCYVILEKVHAMPKQGVTSMFNFGMSYGICLGVIGGLGLSHRLVRPQEWQASILKGYAKGSEEAVAKGLWPNACWLASDKCRKPHSGLIDAALIAEFGRREVGRT